ncbi:MAG: hypothetical protein ABI618_17360 [Nitrospirota bacterium]
MCSDYAPEGHWPDRLITPDAGDPLLRADAAIKFLSAEQRQLPDITVRRSIIALLKRKELFCYHALSADSYAALPPLSSFRRIQSRFGLTHPNYRDTMNTYC